MWLSYASLMVVYLWQYVSNNILMWLSYASLMVVYRKDPEQTVSSRRLIYIFTGSKVLKVLSFTGDVNHLNTKKCVFQMFVFPFKKLADVVLLLEGLSTLKPK